MNEKQTIRVSGFTTTVKLKPKKLQLMLANRKIDKQKMVKSIIKKYKLKSTTNTFQHKEFTNKERRKEVFVIFIIPELDISSRGLASSHKKARKQAAQHLYCLYSKN